MTLAELLQSRFRADLRHRGAAYIKAERSSLVRVTPENVFGVVVDGVEYQTQLRYQENDIGLFCTCEQFARGKACKHLWATVLTADLEGRVNPAIRPGKLLPFVPPDLGGPVTVDDLTGPLDAEKEPKTASRSRRKTAAAAPPQRRLRPWEVPLLELKDEMTSGTGSSRKTQSTERQIFYEIDIEASREAQKLVIQASQRQRRSSGQWGKIKPLKIRPGELEQIEHEDDRVFLSYLAGAIPERNNWSTQQAELKAAAHRFHVPHELGNLILPEMCRTGRLKVISCDDKPQPLDWDDSEPWDLTIRVRKNCDGSGWLVTGVLVRGDETLPLSEVPLVVPGGFVITSDAISQLRDFGAADWMKLLSSDNGLSVPLDDQHDFIDMLLDIPSLPRLDLPRELQLEEVRTTPSRSLRIFTPPVSKWRSDSLTAEVLFDYMGTVVPGRSARWAVVQREENRCIIRDRQFEAGSWDRLRELGFRKRLNGSQTQADVEISRRDLGRAVRQLVEDGWEVFADGSRVRQAGAMKFRVQSDIDWFGVNAEVDFEGRSVAFPELLQALERGDSTVRLDDGSLGILPEEWLEQIGMISGLGTLDDQSLRFSNSQAALLDALLSGQENVEFDSKFEELREKFRSFSGIGDVAVPKTFKGELRDYQRDGLSWMTFLHDFNFGGCLADDMGLGKTVQFIAMLLVHKTKSKKKTGPTLIVVPRSLIFNWHAECNRFAPQLKVLDYTGVDRNELRESFSKYDVILTTYGTVRRDIAVLKDVPFDYVVLDEAQTIKNPSSQIARASRLLQARHRLALSGTPIENNAGDLWSIFEFLNPGMLGRSSAFRNHVSDPDNPDSRQVVARGLRPFILRRTKQEVAAELPDRLEETIYCDMDTEQRRLYDELRLHYRDSLLGAIEKDGLARSKMHVLEALLRLRQAACHPALLNRGDESEPYAKLEFLIPHLKELVAENQKSLVFSQFTSMLSIVRQHLDEAGIDYEYLDGQTRDRERRVNRFQEDDDCRIFLISLKAGGLGLNLTAAEYVFLLDPWWNPAVEAQAIDRAHRVGQTRTVFAYRMICRDTVEEKIAELQKKKRALADAILEGADQKSILKDLSVEDLELLLS